MALNPLASDECVGGPEVIGVEPNRNLLALNFRIVHSVAPVENVVDLDAPAGRYHGGPSGRAWQRGDHEVVIVGDQPVKPRPAVLKSTLIGDRKSTRLNSSHLGI